MCANSLRPLALAEYRDAAAVGVDAVDIGVIGADHTVDMDQAVVAPLRRDLVRLVHTIQELGVPGFVIVGNRTEGCAPLTIAALAAAL